MYCGLDLSLTSTGIVILDNQGEVKKTGTIRTKTRGGERLKRIRDTIRKVLLVYGPITKIFLEDYAYAGKGKVFSIGELGGVIRLLLHEGNEVFEVVAPTKLKKFVTGKGNCGKDVIIKEVFKRWDFDTNSNDVADAYGLAKMAYYSDRIDELPKWQKEIIEKL